MTPKTLASMMLTLAACSCAPPSVFTIAHTGQEQRLDPGNSMLGPACDGTAPDGGIRMSGHAWSYVDVTVAARDGAGFRPYATGAAPADFGVTRFPRPLHSSVGGHVSCSGIAMKTVVRRDGYGDQDGLHLDFDLEVAPTIGDGATRLPVDPTRVRGMFPLVGGYGDGQIAFDVGGREMVATLHVHPGPEYRRAEVRAVAAAANPPEAFGNRAKPLPDEKPGRTLDDVMLIPRR